MFFYIARDFACLVFSSFQRPVFPPLPLATDGVLPLQTGSPCCRREGFFLLLLPLLLPPPLGSFPRPLPAAPSPTPHKVTNPVRERQASPGLGLPRVGAEARDRGASLAGEVWTWAVDRERPQPALGRPCREGEHGHTGAAVGWGWDARAVLQRLGQPMFLGFQA